MGSEEYVLGQDVTNLARGKEVKETVVLSVRLSRQEFARLESIAEASNKTMSQVVREALARYEAAPKAGDGGNTWVHATLTCGPDFSFAWGTTLQKSEGASTLAAPTA